MRPVALQELKQLGDGKHWSVEQQLSELDSIGPVKGWLKALHRGDDLWLEAEAAATVELICDRCLKSYPQPLEARVCESIALQSGGPDAELEELDGAKAALETLDPHGRFDLGVQLQNFARPGGVTVIGLALMKDDARESSVLNAGGNLNLV